LYVIKYSADADAFGERFLLTAQGENAYYEYDKTEPQKEPDPYRLFIIF